MLVDWHVFVERSLVQQPEEYHHIVVSYIWFGRRLEIFVFERPFFENSLSHLLIDSVGLVQILNMTIIVLNLIVNHRSMLFLNALGNPFLQASSLLLKHLKYLCLVLQHLIRLCNLWSLLNLGRWLADNSCCSWMQADWLLGYDSGTCSWSEGIPFML